MVEDSPKGCDCDHRWFKPDRGLKHQMPDEWSKLIINQKDNIKKNYKPDYEKYNKPVMMKKNF